MSQASSLKPKLLLLFYMIVLLIYLVNSSQI